MTTALPLPITAEAEQFKLFISSVSDYAIYMLSADGIVCSWNAGAQRFKGYAEAEIVGQHFSCFYTPEDRAAGRPAQVLAQAAQGRFEDEGWRVRKDGTRFWASVVIDPVHDADGALIGFAKITRDVTERRLAEDTLAQAKEALFQSQKLEAIGKLTGGIAHDFNNLLNVITNGLDLLRVVNDRQVQNRTIDSMERAAKRGASLTQQLLAFARQQPIKPERVNINRTINSFEAVLRRAIRSSIRLEVRLAADVPDVVTDLPQLEAALLNLVVNARDAIDGGGVITLATAVAGDHMTVSVSDTGAGMPEQVVQRAVEPFFTTKEVGKGSGLGLSQVYGLMQQAGGDLAIASTVGAGTCITLRFPAAPPSDEEQVAAADAAEKVLIVDDQPDVLDMATHLFDSLGYQVLAANNGQEALDTLRRHPDIALLFSDVVMPGMSGIELAKTAVARQPALKVILASGYVTSALQEHHPDLDQFPLIGKPYRLSDVIRKLKLVNA
ncbi:MAG: ATP-binding protein [Duganella sp.]